MHNALVTSRRSFSAIPHEVVASAKNFIQQRLNDEQSDQVQAIIDVTNANNETQLIASGRKVVEEIVGKESVQSFADDAVSYFVSHGARSFTPTDSITAKLYELLRNSPRGSVLNKLIQTFLVTSPHRESSEVSHTA